MVTNIMYSLGFAQTKGNWLLFTEHISMKSDWL
jgi:hypothetical protein